MRKGMSVLLVFLISLLAIPVGAQGTQDCGGIVGLTLLTEECLEYVGAAPYWVYTGPFPETVNTSAELTVAPYWVYAGPYPVSIMRRDEITVAPYWVYAGPWPGNRPTN